MGENKRKIAALTSENSFFSILLSFMNKLTFWKTRYGQMDNENTMKEDAMAI